jgi:hypothetical protein
VVFVSFPEASGHKMSGRSGSEERLQKKEWKAGNKSLIADLANFDFIDFHAFDPVENVLSSSPVPLVSPDPNM